MRKPLLIVSGAAAAFAAVAFAQSETPAVTTAPVQEEPFDENPFDVEGKPMSELDALSRSSADPFPTFDDAAAGRRPVSVTLRALDKITARYIDIEAPIGAPARFNSLEIVPRFCDKRPPEEFPETTAFLEIFDRDLARARASGTARLRGAAASAAAPPTQSVLAPPPAAETAPVAADAAAGASAPADPDRIFAGWMFASSPALNALEHPVYDIWVIDCKTEAVEISVDPL